MIQRGASNLYFAAVRSALDIPPDSNFDPFSELAQNISNDPLFAAIVSAPDGPIAGQMASTLAVKNSVPESVVKQLVDRHLAAQAGHSQAEVDSNGESDLYAGEWLAFNAPDREHHPKDRFIKSTTSLLDGSAERVSVHAALDQLVSSVAVAQRLREVRALSGFARYEVGNRIVPPDLGRGLDWLPAIEVYGEGVFIRFDEQSVRTWEGHESVQSLAESLEQRRARSLLASRLRPASARYLMLHTFAHLLIRQLAFECGYAAASLRERVYSSGPTEEGPDQAGVLIYTAAGDTEGTLGGLVAQGQPPRLAQTILRALDRSGWCSTDPLCRENTGQGFQALNRAACHACCLLPETSCENGNKSLDRTLVVGGDGVPGFLQNVADTALESIHTV